MKYSVISYVPVLCLGEVVDLIGEVVDGLLVLLPHASLLAFILDGQQLQVLSVLLELGVLCSVEVSL